MTDITPEGMMLIGEKPIRPQKEYALRMDLPRNVMEDRNLSFSAESKWCRKDASKDPLQHGIPHPVHQPVGPRRRSHADSRLLPESVEGDSETDLNPAL